MKKIILSSVCAVALIGSAAQAQAPTDQNWYVGVDGAYSILGEEKAEGSALDMQNDFKDGWAAGLRLGYDFGDFRLEGEIDRHYHNADRFTIANDAGLGLGSGNVAASGNARLTGYMMNLVYDMGALTANNSYEPFIGAGMGLGDLKLRDLSTASAAFAHEADQIFAYQLFAGIRVPLARAIDASVKYRYKATADATMADRLGQRFKASYGAHDIMFGVTYRFGGGQQQTAAREPAPMLIAPPEPEPVVEEQVEVVEPVAPDPMPEPAAGPEIDRGPHLAYFDWDSSEVRSDAQEVIVTAAREAGKMRGVTINVAGHADPSGPEAYNDKLSRQRAESVKAALVAQGVDAANITIEYFGERRAAADMVDGNPDPKNRRVVVILLD